MVSKAERVRRLMLVGEVRGVDAETAAGLTSLEDHVKARLAEQVALRERLLTDTCEALPGVMPALGLVLRPGDERPRDVEAMVDLGLVPGWRSGFAVFLRTDGPTLRVTFRTFGGGEGDHIEMSVVELYRTSAQVNLVAFAWAAMARKVATTIPITGAALRRLLRDDLREEVEA
jgi:hypothetical protein